MKKILFTIALFLCLIANSQTRTYATYYTYSDSTFMYKGKISTHHVQPDNSTTIKPTGNLKYAKWNGTAWTDISTPTQLLKDSVPKTITKRQLKLQLTIDGFDISTIPVAINQLSEPTRTFALINWEDGTIFERNDALLIQLATMLGIDDGELDVLFINAYQL